MIEETEKAKEDENRPDANSYCSLYTPVSIGIASFFGSVFCGFLMIALNYRALGERRSFKIAFAIALASLPALFSFLTWPPVKRYYRIFAFLSAFAMAGLAKMLQGEMISKHLNDNGKKQSISKVACVILLSLATLFFGLIVYLLITGKELAFA